MLNRILNNHRRIREKIRVLLCKYRAKKLGLGFHEPNYIFVDKFNAGSTLIDVGCADEADFSIYMINRYNLTSYGIDPTKKHAVPLKRLEKEKKRKI